jgi:phosphoglycolate phosphatase
MSLKKYDGIIFDLDGTLWDSTKAIVASWNHKLMEFPNLSRRSITEQELWACMGKPMYDIAKMLLGEETREVQMQVMDSLCAYENEYLWEHGGILYERVPSVLQKLSESYPLFIVSNCQDGYIESFLHAHHLEKFFKDTECWGRTRAPKSESNKILMKRNNLQNAVYVGDTQTDADSAKEAGLSFIFAAYGFGEVAQYDEAINSFTDLVELLVKN